MKLSRQIKSVTNFDNIDTLYFLGLSRRFSNDFGTGSRANLIINQNGEPELVADLM